MFSLTNNLNSAICNEEISVKNYGKAQLYKINSKKMRCSLLRKIIAIICTFQRLIPFYNKIYLINNQARMYCLNDYACKSSLDGASSFLFILQLLDHLEKFNSTFPSAQIKNLIDLLTSSKEYVKATFPRPVKEENIKKIKLDIQSLEVNKSLAIPLNVSKHGMVLLITCMKQGESGEKIYQITHYNTGNGVNDYHHRSLKDHRLTFQRGIEIQEISEEKLCGEESLFFKELFTLPKDHSEGISLLYQKVFPRLGEIAPPSKEKKLWGRSQIGGSCAIRSILALVKSQLPEKEYLAFKEFQKIENITYLYAQIKSGWSNNLLEKRVVLEAVKNLQRNHEKKRKEANQLDESYLKELQRMEKDLIQLLRQEKKVSNYNCKKIENLSLKENLDKVLQILDHYIETENFIDTANFFLNQATKQIKGKKANLNKKELVNLANSILQKFEGRDLSKEEIYIFAKLNFVVFYGLLEGYSKENPFDKELDEPLNLYLNHHLLEFLPLVHSLKLGKVFHDDAFNNAMNGFAANSI